MRGWRKRAYSVGAFFIFFLSLNSTPASQASKQQSPIWWEIEIKLTSEGKYRLNQGDSSYSGDYSFTIIWTGLMEVDDEDYIIYHKNCYLADWKGHEKRVSPDGKEKECPENLIKKPTFQFNYILKSEKNLCFDFFILPIPIPQMEESPLHSLPMPCSKSCPDLSPGKEYGLYINEGSNRIFFEEKEIFASQAKKDFTWSWKQSSPSSAQKPSPRLTHQHKVKVRVTIKQKETVSCIATFLWKNRKK